MTSQDEIIILHIAYKRRGYLCKGRWIAHHIDVEQLPCFKAGQHVGKATCGLLITWMLKRYLVGKGTCELHHIDVEKAHHRRYLVEKAPPADLEVEQIFEVGEWEKLREDVRNWKSVGPGSVGVVQERWAGPTSHLERAERLVTGQKVRVKLSVKQPGFGWSGHTHGSVETISAIDGKLRLYTPLVEDEELHIGDWVKVRASVSTPTHQWGEVNHSSVGVVHRMENGDLRVAFCFMELARKVFVGHLYLIDDIAS
uniref:Uncharacterized protein n=1 Tax=Populus trichocarpa TaxID=3694 RepID=A0A2K2B9N7_POPTR